MKLKIEKWLSCLLEETHLNPRRGAARLPRTRGDGSDGPFVPRLNDFSVEVTVGTRPLTEYVIIGPKSMIHHWNY